jgi:DNA invertase Pin-like site-specific DNA recombinase
VGIRPGKRKDTPVLVGYCRAIGLEPRKSLRQQRARLASNGAEIFFEEKVTPWGGAPELERAVAHVQRGDVLMVTRPYRLAFRQKSVLLLIDLLGAKGVGLRILDTPVDTGTTTGRMLLGSAPLWSLHMSPWRALLWDISIGRIQHGLRS